MYHFERNPKQFELDVNFRSHHGIIKLASSVIRLIKQFFPGSIDNLKEERGEVGGPRPVIINENQSEIELFRIFSRYASSDDGIELGANQVVIIHDEADRTHVQEFIGKEAGLVLTVYEAKGQEFNDVLLYNFFSQSPARLKVLFVLL